MRISSTKGIAAQTNLSSRHGDRRIPMRRGISSSPMECLVAELQRAYLSYFKRRDQLDMKRVRKLIGQSDSFELIPFGYERCRLSCKCRWVAREVYDALWLKLNNLIGRFRAASRARWV